MRFEDFKKLSPEMQIVVLMLERIEKKVDGLIYGIENFDTIPPAELTPAEMGAEKR